MKGLRMLTRALTGAGALACASLFLAASGCDGGAPKVATVQQGDMPSGAKWDGVYYSELYGFLHLKSSGSGKLIGKWERPHKDKWGELEGDVTGDVLHFTYSEYTRGLVGPNAKRTGKGYFKYKRPEGENVDDDIVGQIGQGEDEVGDPWDAKKQRNIPPNLDSIGGSGSRDVGGGDWDSDNKEKGKPEGPRSPR